MSVKASYHRENHLVCFLLNFISSIGRSESFISDKKKEVMRVATHLFSELGFENTSIAKICIESGGSKGLVYHHFTSKKELLRAIFSETTQRMIEMNETSAIIATPKEQLVNLIKKLFNQLKVDKLFFS